jgi:hypothetical protein
LPVAQSLLLTGRQAVPSLKPLANLGLLFWRQTQKALVVPQELFLPLGRHILNPLNCPGRQFVWIASRRNCVGLTKMCLRPRGGVLLCSLLLIGRAELLAIRGAT